MKAPQSYEGPLMRDMDIVTHATNEVKAVLAEIIGPELRDPDAVLQRMRQILDREEFVAAQDRLVRRYGKLRVVK